MFVFHLGIRVLEQHGGVFLLVLLLVLVDLEGLLRGHSLAVLPLAEEKHAWGGSMNGWRVIGV